MGIGDWGLGPIPNPQFLFKKELNYKFYLLNYVYLYIISL